jgi:hypothetical protein
MASQIYSLGATVLFLLTGLAPSSAPGVQPPAVRLRGTPQPIRHLLDRMMRVNPEDGLRIHSHSQLICRLALLGSSAGRKSHGNSLCRLSPRDGRQNV